MKRFGGKTSSLLSVFILTLSLGAWAQTESSGSELNPQFAAASKEVSVGCGVFLPSNVPGITELMSLCGGRYAFKIAQGSMLEAELFTGNGKGQSYDFGAFNYRADFALDDLVASFYIGGVLHYFTAPAPLGGAGSSSINFGADVGTAVWFLISDSVALRGDLQLNVNPGAELFLGLSVVFRFDSGGT